MWLSPRFCNASIKHRLKQYLHHSQIMTDSMKAVNWSRTKQQEKVSKTAQLIAEAEAAASEDPVKGGSQRKADELKGILDQENLKLTKVEEALVGMKQLESKLKGIEE